MIHLSKQNFVRPGFCSLHLKVGGALSCFIFVQAQRTVSGRRDDCTFSFPISELRLCLDLNPEVWQTSAGASALCSSSVQAWGQLCGWGQLFSVRRFPREQRPLKHSAVEVAGGGAQRESVSQVCQAWQRVGGRAGNEPIDI